jgi:hypothetical protein
MAKMEMMAGSIRECLKREPDGGILDFPFL